MTENSVRHISAIKEMEALKYQYQIRCSHYKLEFSSHGKSITCAICQKNWFHNKEDITAARNKEIYIADKQD
ncbi:hypothetical protein BH18THE2_BH18THE2_31870 [soil metagenome]